MKTINFEGNAFTYDEAATKKWSVQKGLSMGSTDPAKFYEALDKLLAGRSDEYAETLGDDADKMLDLIKAISEVEKGDAEVKNSPSLRTV